MVTRYNRVKWAGADHRGDDQYESPGEEDVKVAAFFRPTSDYLEDLRHAPVSSDSFPAAVIGVD